MDHAGDEPAADALLLDGYLRDRKVRDLINTTELWFVPVANPDGYDFTFEPGQRLWRKNLRDNDGDGVITPGDGVDPNRNFAYKWGYDNEGSSRRPRLARPSAAPARTPSPRPRRWTRSSSAWRLPSSSSTTTRPRSCCSTASAGRSPRRRRTT